MSYVVAIPCIAVVCFMVDRLDLRSLPFVLFTLLLTVIFGAWQWFEPGVDVIIASCLSMALANFFAWFIETYATKDDDEQNTSAAASGKVRRFCSRLTHDFAVSPRDSSFAIALIESGEWTELGAKLDAMTQAERQGFFANLNYSSVSERALQDIINADPENADSHILMGHAKLCLSKRLGLQIGATLDEPVALAMSQAFKHFNTALRLKPEDPEALCGLVMAKGFVGLGSTHLYASLTLLLQHDPRHLHGVIAAARFLVTSPSQGNAFVSAVEAAVDGRCEATLVIARIITHIECMAYIDADSGISANRSQLVADMYRQLRCYQEVHNTLGGWQKGIADNVIAYMLQLLGDKEELNHYLQKIEGSVSPYPWQNNTLS